VAAPRLTLAALVLGAVTCGIAAQVLPSPTVADDAAPPRTGDAFVASDGALPQQRPALREPGAPLSAAERGYAITLTLRALPGTSRDVLEGPGAEILAAGLPSQLTGRRTVQVSAYDYAGNRLHHVVVDLTSEKLMEHKTVTGVQPPPNAAESAIATELALAARPVLTFVEEFERLNGAPLLSADQVEVVAGAWLPDPELGVPENPHTSECGRHRCVQLLIATPSGQFLHTGDFVIDLSTRTVVPVEAAHHEH
jgi:hypothetical protein